MFRTLQKLADYKGWVSEPVATGHADKHASEMGLSREEYLELADLLRRLRRDKRVVSNVRANKEKPTIGYDVDGYRLVLSPNDEIVSLYRPDG